MRVLLGKPVVDEKVLKELLTDLQRNLIAADVEMAIAKKVCDSIKKRAENEGARNKEHLARIVYDELVKIVGTSYQLKVKTPMRIMLVGLYGNGKTTAAGKIAKFLQKHGLKPALIGLDRDRPAAFEQLEQLGKQINVKAFKEFQKGYDAYIADTAGRDAFNPELLKELEKQKTDFKPDITFLVVAAEVGNQVKQQAQLFGRVGVDGVILTRMDGTAKGGGALTACAEVGVPISFLGTGEKVADLEEFEPKGFISRLLGWGDLQALLKKAEEVQKEVNIEREDIDKMDLQSFYKQLEAAKKMGPLSNVMSMMGMNLPKEVATVGETKMNKFKYIIDSMTSYERENPEDINASRIARIAKGSGCSEGEVKELLKQFGMMRKVTKMVKRSRGGMDKLLKKFKGLGG
jgi:signal recognition particle subunit SRP54